MKLKLTKEQRWVAYCIMLQVFDERDYDDCGAFLCRVFQKITGIDVSLDDKMFKELLPELWNKRPKANYIGNVWYSQHGCGYVARIKALKQCIEETHP